MDNDTPRNWQISRPSAFHALSLPSTILIAVAGTACYFILRHAVTGWILIDAIGIGVGAATIVGGLLKGSCITSTMSMLPSTSSVDASLVHHSHTRSGLLPSRYLIAIFTLVRTMARRQTRPRKASRSPGLVGVRRGYGARRWESYWGYFLLLLLIPAWSSVAAGPGLIGPLFVLFLSVAETYYFLFQVPSVCHAPTRDQGGCRNNTSGILWGCWINQHRWERLKMLMRPERWEELRHRLCAGTRETLATLSSLGTVASGVAAVIALFLKQ